MQMWTTLSEPLLNGRALKVVINRRSDPVSYAEVLRLWQDDEVFRSFFTELLANTPFKAFRWETPPVTAASMGQAFEFVLLGSPELVRTPDPEAFAEHIRGAEAAES